jgi:hypothetical protein
MNIPDDEPLLTPEQAASILRQQKNTLAAWRHYGRGPRYYKLGRFVGYKTSDLRDYISQQVVVPSARNTVSA